MSPERIGDGDQKSRIRISIDEVGSITLQVIEFDSNGMKGLATVQFKKGSFSRETYKVLPQLIDAIEKDNRHGYFPSIAYDPAWPNDPE